MSASKSFARVADMELPVLGVAYKLKQNDVEHATHSHENVARKCRSISATLQIMNDKLIEENQKRLKEILDRNDSELIDAINEKGQLRAKLT